MKAFSKFLKRVDSAAKAIQKPYTVRVQWAGDTFTHRAANLGEAMNWIGLYPAGTACWVMTRSGAVVLFRESKRPFNWLASITA